MITQDGFGGSYNLEYLKKCDNETKLSSLLVNFPSPLYVTGFTLQGRLVGKARSGGAVTQIILELT